MSTVLQHALALPFSALSLAAVVSHLENAADKVIWPACASPFVCRTSQPLARTFHMRRAELRDYIATTLPGPPSLGRADTCLKWRLWLATTLSGRWGGQGCKKKLGSRAWEWG